MRGPIEDVIGWRLDEVVDLIRGPRETTVRLEVIPDKGKTDQRHVVAIERNKVKLEEQAAQSELLEIEDVDGELRKIGIIEIPAFYIDFAALRRGEEDYKSTTRDVRKLIEGLQAEGAEGLVIDLRNNGGGSLQEANDLTGLFIEYGPRCKFTSAERRVWRDGKKPLTLITKDRWRCLSIASARPLQNFCRRAIQDYGQGIVLGEPLAGKGTVQTLLGMPEGQLKVTESKFTEYQATPPNTGVWCWTSTRPCLMPARLARVPSTMPWTGIRSRRCDTGSTACSPPCYRHLSNDTGIEPRVTRILSTSRIRSPWPLKPRA